MTDIREILFDTYPHGPTKAGSARVAGVVAGGWQNLAEWPAAAGKPTKRSAHFSPFARRIQGAFVLLAIGMLFGLPTASSAQRRVQRLLHRSAAPALTNQADNPESIAHWLPKIRRPGGRFDCHLCTYATWKTIDSIEAGQPALFVPSGYAFGWVKTLTVKQRERQARQFLQEIDARLRPIQVDALEQRLLASGPGTRAVLASKSPNAATYHWLLAMNLGGKVAYVDAQRKRVSETLSSSDLLAGFPGDRVQSADGRDRSLDSVLQVVQRHARKAQIRRKLVPFTWMTTHVTPRLVGWLRKKQKPGLSSEQHRQLVAQKDDEIPSEIVDTVAPEGMPNSVRPTYAKRLANLPWVSAQQLFRRVRDNALSVDLSTYAKGQPIDLTSNQSLTEMDSVVQRLDAHGDLTADGEGGITAQVAATSELKTLLLRLPGAEAVRNARGVRIKLSRATLQKLVARQLRYYAAPINGNFNAAMARTAEVKGIDHWRNVNAAATAPGRREANCLSCSVAVTHTLQQHPASALPRSNFVPSGGSWETALRQLAAEPPVPVDGPDGLTKTMLNWGEGAHAIVRAKKRFWPHHHLNAVVAGGRVILLEGHYGYVRAALSKDYRKVWLARTADVSGDVVAKLKTLQPEPKRKSWAVASRNEMFR